MMQSAVERLLYTTLLVVFVGASLGTYFGVKSLKGLEKQSNERETASEKLRDQIQGLQDRLDCQFTFFGQTNRMNLVITSYKPCIVTDTSTGSTQVLLPSSPAPSEAAPVTSPPNQGGAGNPQQPQDPPQDFDIPLIPESIENIIGL